MISFRVNAEDVEFDGDDYEVKDVLRLVNCDQALTAEVLRVANSSRSIRGR